MAYKSVSYGSRGDSVTALQKKLNEKGFSLAVDGVFGPETRKAVRNYQTREGLQVDGIVGEETWGSLLYEPPQPASPTVSGDVLQGVSDETAGRLASLEQGFRLSAEGEMAAAERESIAALEPEAFQSAYDGEIRALYEALISRPDFRYDAQEDANFQRFARLYRAAGEAAMEDTLGKAAALTGGYGSSYAQTAAQQAYNGYMEQLMALVPELEAQARSAWEAEGQRSRQHYEAALERKQEEKAAWEEAYEAWQQRYRQAEKQAQEAYDRDFDTYKLLLNYFADKAQREQKAAGEAKVNTGAAVEEKKASLSSTAADSLYRAVGNYLKAGKREEAQALVSGYESRLTPAQKKRFAKLMA